MLSMKFLVLPLCSLLTTSISCGTLERSLSSRDSPNNIRLPEKHFVVLPGYAKVDGHWRQTRWAGSFNPAIINAVRIECKQREAVCIEVGAQLLTSLDKIKGSSQIFLDGPLDYEILSWKDGIIVARTEGPVADFDLRISIQDKIATKSFRETKARGSDSADPNIWHEFVLE